MSGRKIKIMYIITALGVGGAEKILLSTIKKLNRKIFIPYVVSLYQENTLADEFREYCDNVYCLGHHIKYNPLVVRKIRKIIMKVKPDIVHTHLPHATIWGRIAAHFAGVKVIITTEHNMSIWKKWNVPFYFLYRWTTKFTNRIIAVSRAIKQLLVDKFNVPPSKIKVIYNGIDTDIILNNAIVPNEVTTLSHPIIGTIGRLHKIKGHEVLIKSMPPIVEKFPKCNLIIIGDGVERVRLQMLAKKLNMEKNIHFLGCRHDPVGILKAIDIFVFPSIEEGLGIALIEACAFGKPCIASMVGGIPEIIKDGINGYLIPSNNPQIIAEKVIYLLNNPVECNLIASRNKLLVRNKFSLSAVVKEIETLYKQTIISFEN